MKAKKDGMKVGDIVELTDDAPDLFDGYRGDQYKDVYENNIKGKVISRKIFNTHYLRGEYVDIEWENGWILNCTHSDWVKIVN